MNKIQLQLNNEILTQNIYRVDNLIEIASSLPEAGSGSGGQGDWICFDSLPTTYAVEPSGGCPYYIEISEDTVGFIVLRGAQYCAYMIRDSYIDSVSPNLAQYQIVSDGYVNYFEMYPYESPDEISNLFVLPIFTYKP